MDFDKNIDQLCNFGLPRYDTYPATSGLQISFIDETEYEEPVTVLEFKDHAYIDADTDDNLLELYLKAARIDVENYLQKSLGVRTIQLLAQRLPNNYRLPWGPVESVDTADYTNFGDILIEGGTDLTIEYTTNASLVNDSIKQAIYKRAFDYYENRGSAGQMPNVVQMILNPFRRVVFP